MDLKKVAFATLSITVLCLIRSANQTVALPKTNFVIGFIGDMSQAEVQKQANAIEFVLSRAKIDLVRVDSRTPEAARAGARQLLGQYMASALIVDTSASASTACDEATKSKKVVIVSGRANTTGKVILSPYCFRLSPSIAMQVAAVLTKVHAGAHLLVAYSPASEDLARDIVLRANRAQTLQLAPAPMSGDDADKLAPLRTNYDAVLVVGGRYFSGTLAPKLKSQFNFPIVLAPLLGEDDIAAVEAGVVVTSTWDSDGGTGKNRDIVHALANLNRGTPTEAGYLGYVAADILVQQKTQLGDGDRLAAALSKQPFEEGQRSPILFRSCDHQAIEDIYVVQKVGRRVFRTVSQASSSCESDTCPGCCHGTGC